MNRFRTIFLSFVTIIISVAIVFVIVKAGNLEPSASPAATMYTLSNIYTRLTTNATSTEGDHSFSPSVSPASSMYTLTQIYEAIPTIDAAKVLSGTSYLGVAGTMTNVGQQIITPTTTNQTITLGYHDGTGYAEGDADLTVGKIKSGVDLFSVIGDYPSATYTLPGDTAAADSTAADILSGLEAWSKAGALITGTMPTQTLSAATTSVSAGYYSATTLDAVDIDLIAGNILSGKTIFGIAGTVTAGYPYGDTIQSTVLTTAAGAGTYNAANLTVGTVKKDTLFGVGLTGDYPSATYALPGDTGAGDAVVGNILSGLEAWTKAGALLTGTMTNVGQQIITPTTTNQTITLGYHDGTGYAEGDADLTAGNIKSSISIFGVAGTFKSLLPDTGQTGCWNATGGSITCGDAPVGQDAEYTAANSGTLDPSFTDNGNETITDNNTNLMWQKCSKGLSGSTCTTGTIETNYWAAAPSYCEGLNFAGQTDWRLPNIKELQSIVNYQNVSPAINTTYFPATQSSYYWSGSTFVGNPAGAWVVFFGTGGVDGYDKDTSLLYVRCVRG